MLALTFGPRDSTLHEENVLLRVDLLLLFQFFCALLRCRRWFLLPDVEGDGRPKKMEK